MAKTAYSLGDILSLDPGATVSSGDIISIGTAPNQVLGVALDDGVSGTNCPVAVKGCYEVAKTTSQAWAVGQPVYFVSGTSKGSTASDGNSYLGTCIVAAGSSATTGIIRLGHPNSGGPVVLLSGQMAAAAATTATEAVGTAFNSKVVRAHLQTNDGTAAIVKSAVAAGTLTTTLSASATAKIFYEILDQDVA